MKFSTRTTYGLRAMIRLAQESREGCVSLSSISDEEKISLGYLERLFARLKKSKLVDSVKGAGGGYRLAKKPEDIDLYEIVRSLEGDINPFHCVDENGKIYCAQSCKCTATSVLVKVQSAVYSTLRSIKLSELV